MKEIKKALVDYWDVENHHKNEDKVWWFVWYDFPYTTY